MPRQIILAAGALAALVFAACASDRGDILSPGVNEFGGKLSQGANRPNVTVTDDNKMEICEVLFSKIMRAFDGGIQSLSGSTDTSSTGTVRVWGPFYGYTQVSGFAAMREDNSAMRYNMSLSFFDYSDSGAVFLGGTVNCLGRLVPRGGGLFADSLVLVGGMAFAGDFQGTVVFDSLFIPLEDGDPVSTLPPTICEMGMQPDFGSLAFQSGGNSFTFNPWFRPPRPCP